MINFWSWELWFVLFFISFINIFFSSLWHLYNWFAALMDKVWWRTIYNWEQWFLLKILQGHHIITSIMMQLSKLHNRELQVIFRWFTLKKFYFHFRSYVRWFIIVLIHILCVCYWTNNIVFVINIYVLNIILVNSLYICVCACV